jgi:hypothetical protein
MSGQSVMAHARRCSGLTRRDALASSRLPRSPILRPGADQSRWPARQKELNTFCWTSRASYKKTTRSYASLPLPPWSKESALTTYPKTSEPIPMYDGTIHERKAGAMRDWAQRRLYCSRRIWGCGQFHPRSGESRQTNLEQVAAGHAVRRRVQNGFGAAGPVQAQSITNPAARFTRRLARLVPGRSPPETARTWARSRRRKYLRVLLVQAARVMPVKPAVSRMMTAPSARSQ